MALAKMPNERMPSTNTHADLAHADRLPTSVMAARTSWVSFTTLVYRDSTRSVPELSGGVHRRAAAYTRIATLEEQNAADRDVVLDGFVPVPRLRFRVDEFTHQRQALRQTVVHPEDAG